MKNKLLTATFVLTALLLLFGGCKKTPTTTEENPKRKLWGNWTQSGGYGYDSQHPTIWWLGSADSGTKEYWNYGWGGYDYGYRGPWSYDDDSKTLVFQSLFYVQTLTDRMLVLIDGDGDTYSFEKN